MVKDKIPDKEKDFSILITETEEDLQGIKAIMSEIDNQGWTVISILKVGKTFEVRFE